MPRKYELFARAWFGRRTGSPAAEAEHNGHVDLLGSPFALFHPGPAQEERLVAYVVREHRRGRHLGEILDDPYVRRHCSDGSRRRLIDNPALIRRLVDDIRVELRPGPSTAG
jgi:hypothetical protein